jgi:hypothetical protein
MARLIFLPSARRLPNGRGAWVRFKTQLPAGDFTRFLETGGGAIDEIAQIVARGIEDWNLEDDEGEKLPIESQYLKKLPSEDFWHIASNLYRKESDRQLELDVMNYLAADPDDEDTRAPWAFVVYKYRRIFRVSWPDFVQTPLHVIQRDLLFMNLERQSQANQSKEPAHAEAE